MLLVIRYFPSRNNSVLWREPSFILVLRIKDNLLPTIYLVFLGVIVMEVTGGLVFFDD